MVRFSEIVYERPDVEGLKTALETAAKEVAEAKDYQTVRKNFL